MFPVAKVPVPEAVTGMLTRTSLPEHGAAFPVLHTVTVTLLLAAAPEPLRAPLPLLPSGVNVVIARVEYVTLAVLEAGVAQLDVVFVAAFAGIITVTVPALVIPVT